MDADERRFEAFLESTHAHERDCLAFCEFTHAVHSAAMCAGLVNPCDDRPEGLQERAMLRIALGQMLFSVLPRVDLATLVMNAEGIGFAVRYGILDAHRDALDGVADTEAFEELAARGYAADTAQSYCDQIVSPRERAV